MLGQEDAASGLVHRRAENIVFETGLNNLTEDETTVLVHYGKDRTRQMGLVHIEQPDDKKSSSFDYPFFLQERS